MECLAACLDRNTHCPRCWHLCNGAVFPVARCLAQDGLPLETLPTRERFPVRAPRHCEKQHRGMSLPPAHLQSLPGNAVLPWEKQEQLWKERLGRTEELSAGLIMLTQLHTSASHPQAVPAKLFESRLYLSSITCSLPSSAKTELRCNNHIPASEFFHHGKHLDSCLETDGSVSFLI